MSSYPSSSRARVRVRLACAALAAICAGALTACGPGGPKPKTADDGSDNGGNNTPSRGITLVAGSATLTGSLNGSGNSARFNTPRGIVVDSGGNLFVADEQNRVIRKIMPDGTVMTFAGVVGNTRGSADGNGTGARFTDPTALAIDASDNLYVLDNYLIRKITPAAVVTTPVTLSNNGDNLRFHPAGIAVNTSGDLFVTTVTDTSRLSTPRYQVANRLESGSAIDYGLGDGVLTPRGIAVDANDLVYVADLRYTISSAAANASALTHLAGVQDRWGHNDGNANTALFNQVVGLTVTKDGTIYAADAQSNTIRQIASNGKTSTLAGIDGRNALVVGGLPGSLANVAGIASDANGYLYVTTGNAVVRIVP